MSPPTYPNALPTPAHLQARSTVKHSDAGRVDVDKETAVAAVRRLYWAVGFVAVGTLITWLVL